jgi:hypothetical protein
MPFAHPILFAAGATAASIPIIIHLLNRRRFRVREWAAMRFLLDSLRKNRRRLRIEELILLALRTLVILLLAAALARFSGCSDAQGLSDMLGSSETVIYVMDDSLSSGQRAGDATVFARATTDLAEQIRQRTGGKIAVLRTSERSDEPAMLELSPATSVDREGVARSILALKPSDQRTQLAKALERASKMFEGDHDAKRLVVMTDLRQVDLTEEAASEIRRNFEALRDQDVRLVVMDYGRETTGNLTIESIEMMDRFALVRKPLNVAVTVRNNGPLQMRNVELSIVARIQTGEQIREVTLPSVQVPAVDPGATGRAVFRYVPETEGSVVLTAQLPADQLIGDNERHLAINVRQALRVLLVDGRYDAQRPEDRESYQVRWRLDPTDDAYYGFTTEVIAPRSLPAMRLNDFDMVVLMDVPEFPREYVAGTETQPSRSYPSLEALERYVAEGGGLAIFTGDQVSPGFYNGPLFDNGNGLLPYRLGSPEGQPDKRNMFVRLDTTSLASNDMLWIFQDDGRGLAGSIRFYAFTPADELSAATASDPRLKPPVVLARFADPKNSPAIVTRQFGKGRVVAFFTTASDRWHDWPSDPSGSMSAVLLDMVPYAARPVDQRLSGALGQPLVYDLPRSLSDASAVIKAPSYPASEMVSLPLQRRGNSTLVEYADPREAGVWELTLTTPADEVSHVLLARNIDPLEGQLIPAGRQGLEAVAKDIDLTYIDKADRGDVDANAAGQTQYWAWLLAAVLTLLAAETFLAQRFGHYS